MGRKNLSKERRDMILDAFERCICKYGLEGTSLDQVAQEVGFRRGLVRHYLGNREEMVAALASRAVVRYAALVEELMANLPEEDTSEVLLDLLFPAQVEADDTELLVMENLIAISRHNPEIRSLMCEWLETFVQRLAVFFQEHGTNSDQVLCWQVAYGLIGVYFNHDSLAPLGLDGRYRIAARESARLLLERVIGSNTK